MSVLIEGEIEVEDGFFEEFGEVDFLSEWGEGYLYSLTMTVSPVLMATMSLSPLDDYFLERGRLRIATNILGCYIFKFNYSRNQSNSKTIQRVLYFKRIGFRIIVC